MKRFAALPPGSSALVATGLLGLFAYGWRKRWQAA